MAPRVRFLTLLAACVPSVAPAQAPEPLPRPRNAEEPAAVYRLRNAAAADVAIAIKDFANQKKWDGLAVTAEPVSNTLVVAGDRAQIKQVAAMVAAIDRQPPQVQVALRVVRVPVEFARTVEIDGDAGTGCELTARETKMLAAAIKYGGAAGDVEVLSRPTLLLTDNQTGLFQVGGGGGEIVINTTPRISADEKQVLLRLEARLTLSNPKNQVKDSLSLQTTASVQVGGTYVTRGMRSTSADGKAAEVMLIATVERVDGK